LDRRSASSGRWRKEGEKGKNDLARRDDCGNAWILPEIPGTFEGTCSLAGEGGGRAIERDLLFTVLQSGYPRVSLLRENAGRCT